MLKVYLLRHGETAYNADGNRYCGRTDISLTEKGLSQANLVCQQMASIQLDAVYSSPLQRAFITAKVASGRGDVITDERLIEVNFGQWEGKTREEFVKELPESWDNWNNDPWNHPAGLTGETGKTIIERVDDFFSELQQRHPNGTVMVVAHNGINRLYLANKLGMPLKNYRRIFQENSSITLFELDETGELTLKLLNSRIC